MSSPTPFGNEPLTIREGEEISGGSLELDGNYFTGCRIEGSEVVYRGGNWGMHDTKFIDCRIVLADRAQFILDTAVALIGRDHWLTLFDQLKAAPTPPARH